MPLGSTRARARSTSCHKTSHEESVWNGTRRAASRSRARAARASGRTTGVQDGLHVALMRQVSMVRHRSLEAPSLHIVLVAADAIIRAVDGHRLVGPGFERGRLNAQDHEGLRRAERIASVKRVLGLASCGVTTARRRCRVGRGDRRGTVGDGRRRTVYLRVDESQVNSRCVCHSRRASGDVGGVSWPNHSPCA